VNSARFQRVRELFHAACECEEGKRAEGLFVLLSGEAEVIRGEGDIAFSAGYDISQIRATPGSDGSQASGEILMRAIRNIKNFPARELFKVIEMIYTILCPKQILKSKFEIPNYILFLEFGYW